jgi:ATP-binding cassette, subfamily B, bacterial PglK
MLRYNRLFLNSPIDKKHKNKFKLCHIFYFINAILEILSITILIPIISFILNIENKFFSINKIEYFNNASETTKMLLIFLFTLLFFFLRGTIQIFVLSYQRKFIAQFQKKLQENVFKRCIFVDLKKLQNTPLSEQLRNISDTGTLTKFTEHLLLFNTNLILITFITFFLLFYNYKITLFFILLFSILSFLFFIITNKFFYKAGIEIRTKTSAVLNDVYNSLNSLKEIIIDKKRIFFFKLFSVNNARAVYINYKTTVYGFVPRIVGELFLAIIIISVFIYFFLENYDQGEIILNLSLFVMAGLRLLPTFVALTNSRQSLKQSLYASERVFEIIKKPFNEEIENITSNKLEFKKSIKLKNISYQYQKSELVLDKLNLTIPKNKVIGLYGESGSGKSTLVNLITGLLIPKYGEINVDNKNIFKKIDEWHNSIGYVPQDVFLIRDSLKNNIAFALKKKTADKIKINKIIKICHLDKLVKQKKRGINFLISERASNISGGQKQRIGIARALYKDPKLLILDETTSNLDQNIELKILKNIKKEYKNITIILISHRVQTLKKFVDYIYKIKNKKIIKVKL